MERGEGARAAPASLPVSRAVYALAIAAIALHVAFSGRYGYFRDELYYAACGQRLAWGYVDHAPLAPLLARLSRALLGDSLSALRFLPALAASAKVLLSGWLARELGGGKYAQFLAAFCVLLAPIYLTFDSFFSMNAFEPVFWTACAAIVLRILNGGNPKLWLLFGLSAGLGILNKHSMLLFGSGIALGLLATSARRHFRQPWIWLGAGIVFLCFLPNLLWEIQNGWPTLAPVSRGDGYEIRDRFTVGIHLATNLVDASPGCANLDGRSVVFAARFARKTVCRIRLGILHSSV